MLKIPTRLFLCLAVGLGAAAAAFAAEPAPVAQVKHIPQRKDDLAWENDRIAHRIYGPALELSEPTGSGIDVWVKSVRHPVIEKWYREGHYHDDRGEGLDFYGVGKSRGCGGLGIWDGRALSTSGHWKSHDILESGGARAVFRVHYAPWKLSDGGEISETRVFTLETGSNLTRCESVFTSAAPELVVGIGIAKGKGGELHKDAAKGVMAYWQKPDAAHGSIGLGVVVPAGQLVGFAEDALNHLVLVRAKPGAPLRYLAGACWSKGLDFKTYAEWKTYLSTREAP